MEDAVPTPQPIDNANDNDDKDENDGEWSGVEGWACIPFYFHFV
jgi:hypothetical protein